MDFIGILTMIGQLILALSILIGVHEAGHLFAAKAFGMRVEQFSIGFPPKVFGFRYKDTVYSLGSIPLGGFVKISGMIDESLDTKSMSEEPKPWEFRSKPAWQRLIVMMGGIIVNVVIGILIFISLTYINGESYISKDEINKRGLVALEIGQEIGLQTGDKIVRVNGADYEKLSDIFNYNVMLEDNSYYTVERNGEFIDIPIPTDLIERISDRKSDKGFIDFPKPFHVEKVVKNTGAANAGLQAEDKIIAIDGQEVQFYHEFIAALENKKKTIVNMTIQREANGRKTTEELQVQVNDEGKIGIYADFEIEESHIQYSFAASIGIGTKKAFEVVWVNIKAFGRMFSGKLNPAKSLRGPIGIAEEFGSVWNWTRFWSLTGLLSMVLAFMNFLPIPALDGGHVAFLSYEMVSGRKPSDKFLENAQKVGMVILLCLMVFVIFNDAINMIFR